MTPSDLEAMENARLKRKRKLEKWFANNKNQKRCPVIEAILARPGEPYPLSFPVPADLNDLLVIVDLPA